MEIPINFIKEKMMKYAFIFLFCLISCTLDKTYPIVQVSAAKGFHSMIKTGLPDIETINQLNFSAKKYGVKFINIGCVTENPRLDSVKKVNDSIYNIVKNKFGDNWLQNLHSELDTIGEVREIAYSEILKHQITQDEPLYYLISPAIQKNDYLVRLYDMTYENGLSQIRTQYNLGVDYKKKLVFEISKVSPQEK